MSFGGGSVGRVEDEDIAAQLGPHPGEYRREKVQDLENSENALLLTAGLDQLSP